MPIFTFGFEFDNQAIIKTIDQNLQITPEFIQTLARKIGLDEFFIFRAGNFLEAFAASEQRNGLESELIKIVQKHTGMAPGELKKISFRNDGPEAVSLFYKRAIGLKEAGEINYDVQEFRKYFLIAREVNLIGPYFNRLYQRGLWLAEKIRIELNLQKSAITPESVISDLAQKIFGDLNEHSALIASNTSECEKFVEKLSAKNIGQLLFFGNGRNLKKLCDQYVGKMVAEGQLADVLPTVDLILLFDEKTAEGFNDLNLSKIMHKRNNAPLLWVSLFDILGQKNKTQSFSKHYNIYSYNREDLDSIVSANLKEHQKVNILVDKLIEKEIASFFDWVNSNEQYRFGSIIGKSESMQKILELIARIAQTDISVLIDGESGTGKELVAKAIHEHSSRVKNPFIVVNCGAIPENLLESELFGHVKGAFTGASSNKKGLIEAANHGTIFLDEIGETSQATQVKLLRFLQEGEIKPVGSNETLKLDARVITATNRDLEKMVEEGQFREDLYYRLNVIQITIAPLRERKEDILPLVNYFIKKHSALTHKAVYGLDEKAEKLLSDYNWPGNVRELENVIERAVALSSGQILTTADLPPSLTTAKPAEDNHRFAGNLTLKDLEKQHIAATLKEHNWNYELVTKILGIGRTTLWRKMKEYNISN